MIGFLSDCRLSSVVGETISVRRSVVTSPAAQEACFNNSPRGESQHLKSEKNVTSLWSGRDLGWSKVQRWTLGGGQHLSKRRSKTKLRNIADFWDQKVPDLFCGERIIFLRPVLILSKVRLMNIKSHASTPSAHLTLISCPTRWSFSSTLGPLYWSSISNTQRTQK